MENNPYIAIIGLFIIVVIALVRFYDSTPQAKGKQGERVIENDLHLINLFGKSGKILRNVYVPNGGNGTAEIDVLFITVKGIFVIESKNYAGYIFGSEKNRNWTVTLYAGKGFFGNKVEKHHFYNPVWQNRTHIRALRNYLDQDIKFISIVVFSDRGELKKVFVNEPDTTVCSEYGLSHVISRYWNQLPDIISEEEVERIHSMLAPLTVVSDETKTAHVTQIRNRGNGVRPAPEKTDLKCPWCGGNLVVRTAKHGPNAGSKFYGCSNFPDCRYTKDIK